MREICGEDAAGACISMRALFLSLLGILVLALPVEAESQAKVLRSISSNPRSATTADVVVSLVAQTANITVTVKYGLDETYSQGTLVQVITRLSPTYSPAFALTGLVHGSKYFVKTEATAGDLTETKTLQFTQNLAPIAREDVLALTSFAGTRIDVLRNDTDPDNAKSGTPVDLLSIKRVTEPAFGRAEIVGKAIVYSPGPAFLGRDAFDYIITDSLGGTSRATVNVTGLQFALFGGHGLLLQDLEGGTAGYLRIDVGRSGSFTGSLQLGGKSYALMGSFDSAGKFLGYARSGGNVVPVSLMISQEDGVTRIRAALANGSIVAAEEASRHTITSMKEIAGRYTLELPAGLSGAGEKAASSSEEFGIGWATMKINEWGVVQIKGETGDRRKFSTGAVLSGSPSGPVIAFYAPQKHGWIGGGLQIGEKVSGALTWVRGKTGSDFYPAGFDAAVNVNGGRWEEPKRGRRALANDSGDAGRLKIAIAGGNVPQFERVLRLSEKDRVLVVEPGEDALNLEIDRGNGIFKGKFRHLNDQGRRSKIRGVLLQQEGRGSGVFEGAKKAGRVSISLHSPTTPAPNPVPLPQPQPNVNPLPPNQVDPVFDFDFDS